MFDEDRVHYKNSYKFDIFITSDSMNKFLKTIFANLNFSNNI